MDIAEPRASNFVIFGSSGSLGITVYGNSMPKPSSSLSGSSRGARPDNGSSRGARPDNGSSRGARPDNGSSPGALNENGFSPETLPTVATQNFSQTSSQSLTNDDITPDSQIFN